MSNDVKVPLTLSEFNDRWNKMALGISDRDVPSRPESTRQSDAGQTATRPDQANRSASKRRADDRP